MADQLLAVSYPIDRERLVQAALDTKASAQVIGLLKGLPRVRYHSAELVLRDLARAAGRLSERPRHP